MKVGIEEEFIVVNPKTLFCTPSAFRLANGMIYTDSAYIRKCSVELPLHSGPLRNIIRNIRKSFSVFEIKTDPYEDIDSLKEELIHHRNNLYDVANNNHLMVLPTGLHPLYSTESFISDNCAALHVHVDYQKEVFKRLYEKIPFLISISANSPFYNGKPGDMSNRLHSSPHISIPIEKYRRSSDIIHNKYLNTVEIRVLDSQITVPDSIGIASIIKAIAEQDDFKKTIAKKDYEINREKAIKNAKSSEFISPEEYDTLITYNNYSKRFLEESNGSIWQLQVYKRYGLPSVIESLWKSFNADKRILVSSDKQIINNTISLFDISYLIPYFPFFFIDKYKKYHQDIGSVCDLFLSLLKNKKSFDN